MLELQGLRFAQGGRELVHNLNIRLPTGETCVVLGSNGVGKSTLLMTIAGLHAPDEGSILLGGEELSLMSPKQRARCLAWCGDLPADNFGLTVHDRLELAAGDCDEQRLLEAAGRFELLGLLNRDMAGLSAGERQRCELAAMLLRDVPIWLLDEPCAHLDLRHQKDALSMIREQKVHGRLVIVVLHDLLQAACVADRVLLLDGKGGWQFGEAAQLMQQEVLESLYQTKLSPCGEMVSGAKLLIPDFS